MPWSACLTLGVLATPALTGGAGGLFNGNANLLFAQAIAVTAVAVYTVVVTVVILHARRPCSRPACQSRRGRPGPRPDPARPARLHDGRGRVDRHRPQLSQGQTVAARGRRFERRARSTRPLWKNRGQIIADDVRDGQLGEGLDRGLASGLAAVGEVDRDDRQDLELGLRVLAGLLVDPFARAIPGLFPVILGPRPFGSRERTKASRAIRSSRPRRRAGRRCRATGPKGSRSFGP